MSSVALIVEDELPLRTIYETVLSGMGFEVMQADDGVAALDILQTVSPSIIFLDMLLPRLDGAEVLDHIQSMPHLREVPVVVLTAHNRFQNLIQLTTRDMFLLKPVRPRDIHSAVEHVLATL